jgi:hypothetical protein
LEVLPLKEISKPLQNIDEAIQEKGLASRDAINNIINEQR